MADTATAPAPLPQLAVDHPAKGKVIEHKAGEVVFKPSGTTYEHHLAYAINDGDYKLPVNKPVRGVVHVKARKLYSVPSGGNFVAPIMGEPRIVQGRVVASEARQLLVHAGGSLLVDLPRTEDAIDLHSGAIEIGSMVNVVCLPGASYLPVDPRPE